jgi:hypothetical protein
VHAEKGVNYISLMTVAITVISADYSKPLCVPLRRHSGIERLNFTVSRRESDPDVASVGGSNGRETKRLEFSVVRPRVRPRAFGYRPGPAGRARRIGALWVSH